MMALHPLRLLVDCIQSVVSPWPGHGNEPQCTSPGNPSTFYTGYLHPVNRDGHQSNLPIKNGRGIATLPASTATASPASLGQRALVPCPQIDSASAHHPAVPSAPSRLVGRLPQTFRTAVETCRGGLANGDGGNGTGRHVLLVLFFTWRIPQVMSGGQGGVGG
jgi:hypothetical protein